MAKSEGSVRWRQRWAHYQKALANLTDIVSETQIRSLNKIEQQGMIQAFEMAHELAWKVLKDYLIFQGVVSVTGSRDTFREAFKLGLIAEGETWMETIVSRNLTTHTYNQQTAEILVQTIIDKYYPIFIALDKRLSSLNDESI